MTKEHYLVGLCNRNEFVLCEVGTHTLYNLDGYQS